MPKEHMPLDEPEVERPAALTPQPNGSALVVADEAGRVMGMFEQAFKSGGSTPEALAVLVDLKEKIDKRNAALEFASAMVEFQTTCPPIPKTSKRKNTLKSGTEITTMYADLEQIIETTRPHLHRLGFAPVFSSEDNGSKLTCICTLYHRNGHSVESRFTLSTESSSPLMSAQDKHAGAFTYAKRQTLIAVLGLSLTDMTPGMEEDHDPTTITEEGVANLQALMDEVGADPAKFLKWAGVERLADIPARQYARAVRALENKRKTGGA